jgi:hypothetical protein
MSKKKNTALRPYTYFLPKRKEKRKAKSNLNTTRLLRKCLKKGKMTSIHF